MRIFLSCCFLIFGITACVPAKKYNDLLEQEKLCQEELKTYKTKALDSEALLKTIQTKVELLENEIAQLKIDSASLGNKYRSLNARYQQEVKLRNELADQIEHIKNSDAKHLAQMRAELEAKILEAQQKGDELIALEKILNEKRDLLNERENRVRELEDIIKQQEEAVSALKQKIANALLGFEGKGLTVYEKNGKVYVSLEAELLFKSGSIAVEPKGKEAIINLANVLAHSEDLEVIVEGHTDTDALRSSAHPKDNWELSVLRATSVVKIMTENTEIDPGILLASGRSEYHPVDEFDKAKNRRIEVIISPKLDTLFELISTEKKEK